ncbi:MAG: tetratricopeptide repeat protein, partial [Nocardioides sp.]
HLEPRAAAWARTWLAEVARKQGHFEDSLALLAAAADEFAAVGDDHGAGQVWHFSGTLAAQQGDLDAARERYERSLAIRESLGDSAGMAALFSNLAIVAEYSGDYEHAEDLAEQGLALRRELGDRWGIGISQNNLGMLATLRGDPEGAKRRFEESMRLHAEVGDAWMVALGHNNLGNAARDLGEHDEARASYSTALSAYRGYADLWVLAILFEDVAILDAALGRPESGWLLVGAADALHARLGSPRTPDSAARIHAALDELRDQLPTTPEDLRTRGAALSDAAVDRLVRAEP